MVIESLFLIALLFASAALHEAGHRAAGRLQGGCLTKFAVGSGRPLLQGRIGRASVSLCARPFGGACFMAYPKARDSWAYARRVFWVSLAGPLATALVLLALLCAPWPEPLRWVQWAVIACNLWMLVQSLRPLEQGRINDAVEMAKALKALSRAPLLR